MRLHLILLTAASLLTASAWAAPNVKLQVIHRSSSIGSDGIQRDTLMTERVIRRGNTVWIQRLMPKGSHHELDHKQAKPSAEHKHADLSSATRWIERQEDGKLRFRLVAHHDGVVIDVAANEYATVGFDGNWDAAYHLIEPKLLKKMQAGAVESGAQWFETGNAKAGTRLQILWSAQYEIPLKVISSSPSAIRTTTARIVGNVPDKPWGMPLAKFANKDYSDFLD